MSGIVQYLVDCQICSQNMLTDMSSKSLFTTLNEETRSSCPCGNYDRSILRDKLEEILNCLYQQISAKEKQIESMRKQEQESAKEKQEIIQRLASANSRLVMENQQLLRRLAKSQICHKATFAQIQARCNAKIREMAQQMQYLEQTNQYLRRQIRNALSLIPQQLILKPKSPQSRYLATCPSVHETRYSQLSYQSPGKRLSKKISQPKFHIVVRDQNWRKSLKNSKMINYEQQEDKRRSKSSIAKQLLVNG